MVFQLTDDDFIVLADIGFAERKGECIEAVGSTFCEDYFLFGGSTEKVCYFFSGEFMLLRSDLAEMVNTSVYVGIAMQVGIVEGVEHR